MFKVLLDSQATLHVLKNDALVSDIRPNCKANNIGGINGS